ncbi:MAG: DUF2508 family protein [Burkholderiales bacterium]
MTFDSNAHAEDVRQAYSDLKAAENYFDNVDDPDLIDFAIYDLEAAKKKYEYMLKKAREDYHK